MFYKIFTFCIGLCILVQIFALYSNLTWGIPKLKGEPFLKKYSARFYKSNAFILAEIILVIIGWIWPILYLQIPLAIVITVFVYTVGEYCIE